MMQPWLDIVGIGEDGLAGLGPAARNALEQAEIILGGDRHHSLAGNISAKRLSWPSPFNAMIDTIESYRGRRMVVLVTGDPLWYSVGARIIRAIPGNEMRFHPQLSAFQWASVRLGWSLADCETVTIHGRPDSQILPFLAPGVRMLVLTQNSESPKAVAKLLCDRGFGRSRMIVLAALGGKREERFEGRAESWAVEVPDFHLLALECVADIGARWYPRTGGLPDEAFTHDGQITKQAVRALTLARLAPYRDAVLWDIGAGCGSISVEWTRAAPECRAFAIERDEARVQMMTDNARNLGAERIEILRGRAPEALSGLSEADAIFIGGGLTNDGVFDAAWKGLRAGGRLVANGVTLESETMLASLQSKFGGELTRLAISHAEPVGKMRGWRSMMPVTQWFVIKDGMA